MDTDANWTYIRRSEDVQHAFWTSYARSIYALCPRGPPYILTEWKYYHIRNCHIRKLFSYTKYRAKKSHFTAYNSHICWCLSSNIDTNFHEVQLYISAKYFFDYPSSFEVTKPFMTKIWLFLRFSMAFWNIKVWLLYPTCDISTKFQPDTLWKSRD